MNIKITRRSAMSVLVGIAVLFTGHAAQAGSLSGSYTVTGRNPNGSAYSGTVQVVENNGAVAMTWLVAGTTYTGVGTVQGRVVTVDWSSDAPVIYVTNANGTLYGTWANGYGLELLAPR